MADDITFIVHKEWLDSIKDLPVAQQDKIIADIIRYGVELDLEHKDDPITNSFVNLVRSRIDYSKEKYTQKIEMSKRAGRKKTVDDNEILRLAREGKTATEIALLLGCSKSAVDHSPGWKERNNFLQKL